MSLRRGACPTLSEPMQTGDGLLARLNPVAGMLTGRQLAGLARAAALFGNGIIEITARGSLQLRGLTADSATRLGAEVGALGISARTGFPVDVDPLAGLDAGEIADARDMARRVRERCEALGLPARLGPKVSVTVDGGGVLGLGGIAADVKLEAEDSESWVIRAGSTAATARVLGCFPGAEAVALTSRILAAVAERGRTARARDLSDAELRGIAGSAPLPPASAPPSRPPVGRFDLHRGGKARGFALAYGQIVGDDLVALLASLGDDREIRLARGRGLIVVDVGKEEDAHLVSTARRLGLVTSTADPRLSIAACAGRPACASAHLATRRVAEQLATRQPEILDGSFTLHISGCEKQCARPSGPAVTIVGGEDGHEIHAEGCGLPRGLEAALSAMAEEELRQET